MLNKELLERIGKLGYPLFDTDNEPSANETIRDVVKSNDVRLWEGFPIILATANKEKLFEFDKMKDLLKNKNEYKNYSTLLLLSLSLYKVLTVKFGWADDLYDKLTLNDKNKMKKFVSNFKNNTDLKIGSKRLNPQRITATFANYSNRQESEIKNIEYRNEELSLEYAMSQIFTAKQKEILLKRAQGKKLTKTEREYFYRVVKKKAIALANPDLQKLAQRVIV